jgi:hypothetical protein
LLLAKRAHEVQEVLADWLSQQETLALMLDCDGMRGRRP